MVSRLGCILGFFWSSCYAIESLIPKDPTANWCNQGSFSGIGLPDWYHCYPNPLGVDQMDYWWRFPDTSQVNACLLIDETMSFPLQGLLSSQTWYEYPVLRWGGPMVPRIDLDLNEYCASFLDGRGGNFNLKAGDSIRLEYKMTPRDTSVSDTIRGEMKAYFTGYMWSTQALRFARGQRTSASWRKGQILLSRPEQGPFELVDLRGHLLSNRARIDGPRTWVVPSSRLGPGLYQLRWPGGRAGVVVPR